MREGRSSAVADQPLEPGAVVRGDVGVGVDDWGPAAPLGPLVANVSFVLAVGAGSAAALLWIRERRSRRSPVITPTGTGAAVRFEF